jgi:probable dihydroxyacetone kinase regulator
MDSFKELLTQKTMDRITVKEICEQCNVNRQTFYNHFDNIIDLFKSLFYEELSTEIGQNKTLDTWQKEFLATLSYLRVNSMMIIHMLDSSYWPEIKAYCATLSNRLLDKVVGECMEKMGVQLADNDRRFIVNFYRRALNGLIIDWVREGMVEEPEHLLKKLLTLISGGITRSIAAFNKGKS